MKSACPFVHLLFFHYDCLLLPQDKLALNVTTEQGKTLKDAHGDVFRGLG